MQRVNRLLAIATAALLGSLLGGSLIIDAVAQPQRVDPVRYAVDMTVYTPDDDAVITRQPAGLMLPEDGDVAVILWASPASATCEVLPLLGSVYYPFSVRKVCETDTDAESVFLFYGP